MCDVACAKRTLFLFNFLFWISGLAVLGIGIWILLNPTVLDYISLVTVDASDPLIKHAAVLFIIVGSFVVVVGFVGCCGALREHQGLLFIYAFLLVLIMAAEISAAILAIVYRSKVESILQKQMAKELRDHYTTGSIMAKSFDQLQQEMKCCGVHNYTDYIDSSWRNETLANGSNLAVPYSCCDPDADKSVCEKDAFAHVNVSTALFTSGCYMEVESWLHNHLLIVIAVGFAVAALEIFGLVTALCLRNALKTQGGSGKM